MLKDLLHRRSNSPPSLSKTILDHVIKGHCEALQDTALLAQDNANLRMANTLTGNILCQVRSPESVFEEWEFDLGGAYRIWAASTKGGLAEAKDMLKSESLP